MIEGVLFDMDGLLVDTEPIYHNANTEAIASMGYEPDDAYLRQCMGLSVQAWGEALYAHYDKDFPLDEMRRRMDKIRTRVFEEDGIQSMKGAKELLDYLDEKGIPKAVASSTPKEKAQYILGRAGLGGRFEVEVYGDMVKRSKPNPDIFLLAASLLGKEPEKCMGLEDSQNGIRACRAANLFTVWVPDLTPVTPELLTLADRKVDSLLDVITLLEELNRA